MHAHRQQLISGHEEIGCSRNRLMHFSCDPTHKAGLPDNTLAKAQCQFIMRE